MTLYRKMTSDFIKWWFMAKIGRNSIITWVANGMVGDFKDRFDYDYAGFKSMLGKSEDNYIEPMFVWWDREHERRVLKAREEYEQLITETKLGLRKSHQVETGMTATTFGPFIFRFKAS